MPSVPQKLTRGEYVEWLRLLVHEKRLVSSKRARVALGCFALAQEHHHAIVLLTEHRLFGAAFALVRVGFEAYIRGEWLSRCATDEEIARFIRAEEPPKLDKLLEAIEKTPGFEEQVLSQIKATIGARYVHTPIRVGCTFNVGRPRRR